LICNSTRQILRAVGPKVGASRKSAGGIAIAVLNDGLRLFLAKWHPHLQTWEAQGKPTKSPKEHEQAWGQEPALREELEALRKGLGEYAKALAPIAGI
jgi:hypothetical protein